jgi:transcriptional regulator with XRE-family HTH domain
VGRVQNATNIYEQKPDDDTPGGRLSRAREASNLTVRDIAWKLSVRQSTIAKWESDRSMPSAHQVSMLAGVLNVSLSWLLHGVGTGPVETEHDDVSALSSDLERLVALHAETARLLKKMETDLARRSPSAP